MSKGELAESYFRQGYNCSQAVVLAFCDEMGIDKSTASRMTIGLGGGIGRMREVCGTISGAAVVLGCIYRNENKSEIYRRVQHLAGIFKEHNGSVVCRELLGLSSKGFDNPQAEPRTQEYYRKRPCPVLIRNMADELEKYLNSN